MAWLLDRAKPESAASRRSRNTFATLLVISAVVSLLISPMTWPLLVVYGTLGLIVGLLQRLDELAGLVSMPIIVFGLLLVPNWLYRLSPHLTAAWWQPGLIVLGSVALVHLFPLLLRRANQFPS